MDRCPDEVLLIIFTRACMDGGTTGRALSLVSNRIHRVSATVKYQSLVVNGHSQISALAARFADLRHDGSGEHPGKGYKQQASGMPRVGHLLVSILSLPSEAQSKAAPQFTEDKKAAFFSLLELVSPTLLTLFTDSWPAGASPSLTFPRLAAFSLPDVRFLRQLSFSFPSLTHLHLTTCSGVWTADSQTAGSGLGLWGELAASPLHDTLSHLRLSGVQLGNAHEYLRLHLDLPGEDKGPIEPYHIGGVRLIGGLTYYFPPGGSDERQARETAVKLPMLKNVWIETRAFGFVGRRLPQDGLYRATVSGLRAVARRSRMRENAGDKGGRLVLLRTRKDEYGFEQLLEDWKSYVEGGTGPWTEDSGAWDPDV
ncbi:hypothetical protein PUNSTDRAFT_46452 [Punctularia strigosozonata HHB-11173 SS5]|uniref:uncharacterized protein n=1 Tax=Punctularia strigosozonata (strain HHB-11173) TaxID=741275 RepID=UPI00044170C7|nr:uncharacterized protein PUNSTDRAFT_46452 [Punctularia strigosozonata HHB-11173 SS5]EIN06238.1 hypothetical protein PUNSTDRAFT_46452 [Punctularia strigosozonata HHB-11173 SS5]